MASLGELFIELAFKGDASKLEPFEKKLKSVVHGGEKAAEAQEKFEKATKKLAIELGVVAGAIGGAIFALNKLTNSLVENNNAMLNLTRQSDIALSTFQKWDSVGRMFGINNAASQLENLNERLFELRLTGQGARGFQLAGIMPTNAEDVMEQLRNRIRGMDNTSATYLLKQMGLDPKMITLLRMSREEYERLGNEMKKYQLTDEQRQQIQKMNVQIEIARQKIQYLKDKAIIALLPYFEKFMEYMGNLAGKLSNALTWLTQSNSGWAKFTRGLIKGLAVVIAYTTIMKTIPLLCKGIVLGITAIRSALTLLAAHPIIAGLTLLITGLMLLVDDIMGYYSGKNSVFGAIINTFKEFEETGFFSDDIPEWLQWLVEVIDKLYEMWTHEKAKKETKKIVENGNTGDSVKNIAKRTFRDFGFFQMLGTLAKDFVKSGGDPGKWLEMGYKDYSEYLFGDSEYLIPPQARQNIQNNNQKTNYSSNQVSNVTQTNYIQTTQSYDDLMKSNLLLSNAMFIGQ